MWHASAGWEWHAEVERRMRVVGNVRCGLRPVVKWEQQGCGEKSPAVRLGRVVGVKLECLELMTEV
jgi:hypothetical protein